MRKIVIGIAILYFVVAAILLALGLSGWLLLWLVLDGGILLVAVLGERWRYRPRVNRHAGPWQPTGERFLDPSSGRQIEVYYNPVSGERDYVDVDPGPGSPPPSA